DINKLAVFALNEKYTLMVIASYQTIFPDIISRWISNPEIEKSFALKFRKNIEYVPGTIILSSLARIVPFVPESIPLIQHFIIQNNFLTSLHTYGSVTKQTILVSVARLISDKRDDFSSFFEPTILTRCLSDETPVIKYLTLQILSLHLQASEDSRFKFIDSHIGMEKSILGDYEGSEEVDYFFFPLLEAKRIANGFDFLADNSLASKESNNTDISITITRDQLSPLTANIGNVLVPRLTGPASFESELVPTESSLTCISYLAESLRSGEPILLTGPAGSGKTFFINEIAKCLSKEEEMVRIHLGDQTDAKLLIGTYATGQKPGSFEWRPGVLTMAVREGRWVLIEDIDKAPTDVLSVLLPLLEKKELLIPSRGEVIKAKRGFQIIGTMRTTINTKTKTPIVPDLIGMRMWKQVSVGEPTSDELKQIIKTRFPIIANLTSSFVDTYYTTKDLYVDPKFISVNKSSLGRQLATRDLVKWARRVVSMLSHNDVVSSSQELPAEIYDNIFAEAIDCFASFIPSTEAREMLAQSIGQSLDVSSARVGLFLKKHVPSLDDNETFFSVGRAYLEKSGAISKLKAHLTQKKQNQFANTNHSLRLMEQIGVSVTMAEPVLLVGETGTGKTTVVQHLANALHKNLTVINVSQQTESGDLIGGYKPIDAKLIAVPLKEEFDTLFELTFSTKKNEKFSNLLIKCFAKGHWGNTVKLWKEAVKMAHEVLGGDDSDDESASKKRRKIHGTQRQLVLEQWNNFKARVENFEIQVKQVEKSFVFSFVEGSLVKAVRNGDWVLLDEINLAAPDTLESISDLLAENGQGSIILSEKGDAEAVKAHPNFRLFACMNPATDIGKRDLPTGLRSRFTELYVTSPDEDIADLLAIIDKYIGRLSIGDEWVGNDVAQLYLEAKKLAEAHKIVDGANQRPHFSIRTLSRTLTYVSGITHVYGLRRSLYEGFCMSFLTLLDSASEEMLHPIIKRYTIDKLKNARSVINQIPPAPQDGNQYVQFKHYWLQCGINQPEDQPHYIITPFVEKNMANLIRATAGRRFPVLIQGPTSSGKTSMVNYLAKKTGNKFVRINNHEHTDLQEYLGSYVSDANGKLYFQEGILVEALRKGYWIVLDELNLAPTDVLEALNRLLDDNRELLIPETQEVVRPHPHFMLFATQNPPGLYGGRKVLSRAFRNRFLELHFDDIPENELETIIRERCQIAPTYSKKIVDVYRQLSVQRQSSRIFEQKNSFATLRDLFRWAGREAVGYEQLAANGYMLLAERVRRPEEKIIVKEAIEKIMKVKLDPKKIYASLEESFMSEPNEHVIWTKAMRKLAVLVNEALKNNEPILLVGETGCGKTTICQVLAEQLKKELNIVNAHQNTETGDIIGAQRPVRNRSELQESLAKVLTQALVSVNIEPSSDLQELGQAFDIIQDKSSILPEVIEQINDLRAKLKVLFEWADGSLIKTLKSGDFFLLDEISLADDSVLERLNSVLEPERTLLLAEKGTNESNITAKDGFQFFATMNPGGDYGKKELSPALRNRFTEIWVPSMDDFEDVLLIVRSKLNESLQLLASSIVKFSEWFAKTYGAGDATSGVISLRDILAWVGFSNSISKSGDNSVALLHGACMVFIDSLGTNNTAALAEIPERLKQEKIKCVQSLSEFSKLELLSFYSEKYEVSLSEEYLSCGPFTLQRIDTTTTDISFNMQAPTTAANAMRVVRGMQVNKPILLEGSPGVGKTSLITALAAAVGRPLTRINLSEQTDLMDLFGSDSPSESGKAGEFVWRDAAFLRAMQKGEWVLLDEMNLASQSVLEGLNACLDHRSETYIPELDKTFKCHPGFTVFAAQNPQYQGGGRKGLPKSFVNRFTVVYIDVLSANDLKMIGIHLYPSVGEETVSKMIEFVSLLNNEVAIKRSFGHFGSPWEFNMRDTMRWLQLVSQDSGLDGNRYPSEFLEIIFKDRFRTPKDRELVDNLYKSVFNELPKRDRFVQIGRDYIQAGHSALVKSSLNEPYYGESLSSLQCNSGLFETMLTCIQKAWPLILVGPSNSGKTSSIRFLAKAVGARLEEFSMNSDIDSMDIVGGFEQVDLTHKASALWGQLQVICLHLTTQLLTTTRETQEQLSFALELFELASNVDETTGEILEDLITLLAKKPVFGNEYDLRLQNVFERVTLLNAQYKAVQTVKFEWFDGILVKAVEEGFWLVLDNANLCSPSVLDRLNSLLEHNGSLIVNECALSDGRPRVIKPHPKFRLFLTVDPKYGELSRAMRNRGTEIFVDDLQIRSSDLDKGLLKLNKKVSVVSDLSTLAISSKNRTPVVSVLDPTESTMRLFALLDFCLSQGNEDNLESIIGSLLSVLPTKIFNIITRWASTLAHSDIFTSDIRIASGAVTEKFTFLAQTPFWNKLREIYSITFNNLKICNSIQCFSEFEKAINIETNVYLNDVLLRSLQIDSKAIGSIIDLLLDLWKTKSTLLKVTNNSLRLKPSEMTYLEKSAVVSSGKAMKNPPRVSVYDLVTSFIGYQEETLSLVLRKDIWNYEKSCAVSSNGDFWNLDIFNRLKDVQTILNDVIYLSNNVNIDESQLHVYRDILDSWLAESKDIQVLTGSIQKLEQSIVKFGEQLDLKSGTSMRLIWQNFKPSLPRSEEAWKRYDTMKLLANRFDSISGTLLPDSIEAVNSMRNSIIQTFFDVIDSSEADGSFNTVMGQLEAGISRLESLSTEFFEKRANNFTYAFKLLFNAFEVYLTNSSSMKISSYSDNLMALAYYSNNGTLNLTRYTDSTRKETYPSFFKNLWNTENNGEQSMTRDLFGNGLLKEILFSQGKFSNIAVKDLKQSHSDLGSLGLQISKFSEEVFANKVDLVKEILSNNIKELLLMHFIEAKIENPLVNLHDIAGLNSFISQVENLNFKQVFSSYILPAISLIIQDYDSYSTQLSNVGAAWVLFSSAVINIYVPDIPFDPAIREHVDFRRTLAHYNKQVKDFASKKLTFNTFYNREDIGEEIGEILSEEPATFRSLESEIFALHKEWEAFVDSSIGLNPASALLKSIQEEKENSNDRVKMFQINSTQFMNRVETRFGRYGDLSEILNGHIYGMKLGFDMVSHSNETSKDEESLAVFWSIDALLLSSPLSFLKEFSKIKIFIKNLPVDSFLGEKVLVHLMRIGLLHKSVHNANLFDEVLQYVFQTIYYRWSLRRLRSEESETANSSLYKGHDEEEEAEKEFAQLFPDYEEVLNFGEEKTGGSTGPICDDEVSHEIMVAYINLFKTKPNATLLNTISSGVLLGHKIVNESSNSVPSSASSILPGLINSHLAVLNGYEFNIKKSESFDFYRASRPQETTRVTTIISNLYKVIKGFSEKWPEHATLQNILISSGELLSYPITTPVARFLQKVEQIYSFLAEWQKLASREFSVTTQFDELTSLIISWRKLELSTWPSLFEFEESNSIKEMGKWWFYLFENIIQNPSMIEDGEDMEEIFVSMAQTLNIFVSQSTFGQYKTRIALLESFRYHACALSDSNPLFKRVASLLDNIIIFYEQFVNEIDNAISNSKQSLKKDFQDIILLASWKDTNIIALKESARRSHHKLYKVVRKYRQVLAGLVTNVVEGGVQSSSADSPVRAKNVLLAVEVSDDKLDVARKSPVWGERPARLQNINLTIKNINVFVSSLRDSYVPSLQELAGEILEAMETLKKETPGTLTDTNKKEVSALKARKSKFLSDTLKELQRLGLKVRVKPDVAARQSSVNQILSSAPSFAGTNVNIDDKYFFRILEMLPRLRAAVQNVAADVPVADIHRGLAISENLLSIILDQRNALYDVASKLERFNEMSDVIGSLSATNDIQDSLVLGLRLRDYSSVSEFVSWLLELLLFAISVCASLGQLGNVSGSNLSSVLRSWVSRFTDSKHAWSKYDSLSRQQFITNSTQSFLAQLQDELDNLVKDLAKSKKSESSVAFIVDLLLSWIKNNRSYVNDQVTPCSESFVSLTGLNQELMKLSDMVLVAVQKIHTLNKDIEEDEDNWFTDSQKLLVTYSRMLYVDQVTDKILHCLETYKNFSDNEDINNSVSTALFGLALPFIKQYANLIGTVLDKIRANYSDVSKASYILFKTLLNLATSGFCSPEEASEEKDSGATQDGTGLGDGEGAQDHSKDIEEDEDLSEYAQTENKDQEKDQDKGEDEEDNAVEIEGDMAGQVEDCSDQEKDDEDSEDEDGEEEELDEEVGELDELDPNSVDEKMWDEEAGDDKKEKESDDVPENGGTDDAPEANEDDAENTNQNQQTNEDGMQEDENASEGEEEEEEDVGFQEDDVKQQETEELDPYVEETETLELPDDLNLDGEDAKENDEESNEEFPDDGLDKMMEDDEAMDEDSKDEEKDDETLEAGEADEDQNEGNESEDENKLDEEELEGSADMEVDEDGNEDGNEGEEGEELDDDLDPKKQKEEQNEDNQAEESAMQADIDGLHGPDNDNQDNEDTEDAAVKQESGQKNEGADASTETEENNAENTGGDTSMKPEDQEEAEAKEEENSDEARDNANESLKQLGDALKEFHKRRQEIKEESERDNDSDNSANTRPDDFEHVQGEDSSHDTQAMGSATQDIKQQIDDNMAIEDNDEINNQAPEEHEAVKADNSVEQEDESMDEDSQDNDNSSDPSHGVAGSMVGERNNEADDWRAYEHNDAMDIDSYEESEVDSLVDDNDGELLPYRDINEARAIWKDHELTTQELSQGLTEQLRLILEPTLATKLRGDFKTGKRLNMKRIIPYIASQFKKDKIWMRRTKPSKRQYQIMIAVDDSKSMSESKSVNLAFQTIALVSKALTQLESGQLAIARFGEFTQLVHPFQKPFSSEAGSQVLQWFGFEQTKTDVKALVNKSLEIFEEASRDANQNLWKLEIIISDGVCEDHDTLRRLVRKAREEKIMLVFVIVDGINKEGSIMEMNQVKYDQNPDGSMALKMERYLDKFPFDFYVIVKDIAELPGVLSLVLRQYFAEVA
ncbi:midasin, partial [Nadsonia fulvescens var. elongata DSM 6958]